MTALNITRHPLAANGYFYLEDKLYRVMQVIRASDYLTAWNFHDNGMEEFIYSDVRRRAEPAFRTKEVAGMVNRSTITVRDIYQEDKIPRPKKTYPLNGTGDFTPLLYSPVLWSKRDIYRLHDVLVEGMVNSRINKKADKPSPRDVPSRAELRAVLDHGTVHYIKDKTGQMVKVWEADGV